MEHEPGRILLVDFSALGEKARSVQKIFDGKKGYRELKTLEPREYDCRLIKRLTRKNDERFLYWLVLVDDPAFGLPLDKAENWDRTGRISVYADTSGNSYFEN